MLHVCMTEKVVSGKLDLELVGILIFIFALILVLVSIMLSASDSYKSIVIENKVKDVDISNDDYMTITFDNDESYRVSYDYYDKETDLTVNSEMKIKLSYRSCWAFPNTDNVWNIVQIVKIPD